jgi:hypothetical protein
MRIIVAAVGRLKKGPETELVERYRKRAGQTGRNLGWRDVEIIEIRESRADDAAKRMIEESIALATIIPQGAAVALLDPNGENLDSASLADRLAKFRRDDRPALGAKPARQGKLADILRRRHLAAPAGARHAAGAALPRRHDPDRASVSSGVRYGILSLTPIC